MEFEPNYHCPFPPDIKDGQMSGKQRARGCLILCLFVIFLLFLASYMGMRESGIEKIYPWELLEHKIKKVEKLKPLAYAAAKRKYKQNSKISPILKFEPYKHKSVSWVKGNKFICTMGIASKSNLGNMTHSTFILELEYCGENAWILMKMKKND